MTPMRPAHPSAQLALAAAAALVAGCGTQTSGTPTDEPAPDSFRVVGYVNDKGLEISDDQLAQLTHLNYAFVIPGADGSVTDVSNPWKLEGYVERAHERGIEVLVSVGGWGWDNEFEALAADPVARARFVDAVTEMVEGYGLDGADIDWEYPDPGASAAAFTSLMQELRASLPQDRLLTAAVAAVGPGADGVTSDVYPSVDFLNVMAYDGSGPAHSPMSYAEAALDYWAERGLPAGQTVLGVPFYSRPQEVSYRELVDADPAAADGDEIEWLGDLTNYNGPATIRAKTELAKERASGVMIWTVADDTTDETSLLRAITGAIGDR